MADELAALRLALDSATSNQRALQELLQARQRELEQARGTAVAGLMALRSQLDGVSASVAWRYGHATTRTFARLRGRAPVTAGGVAAAIGQVDRLLEVLGAPFRRPIDAREHDAASEPAAVGKGAPTRADELWLGSQIRQALGPPPARERWPGVSCVIVSRSRTQTAELIQRLAEVDYPALEVVVVDNASPDREVWKLTQEAGGVELVGLFLDHAASYAEANNRGAQLANSELILFANDDIRPVEPDWLRELVCTIEEGTTEIAGATLVAYAWAGASAAGTGWSLEQRGITLEIAGGEPAPVRREAGNELVTGSFGIDVPALAVSGACMLVRASTLRALGGWDSGYQYGLEDVDLCLRARAQRRSVACSGRAVVIHGGSSSQRQEHREFRRVNRAINRRRFRQLWAPTLRRERIDGLLAGDPIWGTGPKIAIARTSSDPQEGWGDYHTARELGEAVQALGWQVSYLAQRGEGAGSIPEALDIAVVLTDRWDVRDFPADALLCAWIRNWTERWLEQPWLDRYDVLLASSSTTARLVTDATGRAVELFPLATNPRRFHPPAVVAPELDWVFTGNRWDVPRAIEQALDVQRGERAAIYGRGWERVRHLLRLAKGAVAYDSLPELYGTAKVVLDDTAEPTLAYGAVNARVFDALACGVPVITNCEAGVRELFDEEFPTWSSAQALRGKLDELLSNPARRTELAGRYRRTVLAQHTYEHRARGLKRIVAEHNRRLSFCLKVGAPDCEQAERWGDLHLARGLGRALRRAGHRWRIDLLPEWEAPTSSSFDVVVHLFGRSRYAPAPGQFNVLWLISHPESAEEALAAGYDLVCVASSSHAERLRDHVGVPVRVLEQATDPRVFYPDPDPRLAHELVFVGNSRGVRRKILEDLLPTGRDLAVWGGGWKHGEVQRHLAGDQVPNEQVRKIYSSASIVLCDHWDDMRAAGFRSNRLYDALACGALVLSDRVAGLDGSLGEAVVTYEHPDELQALIDRLLSDPDERARRSSDARARVLATETFDHRAQELLSHVRECLSSDQSTSVHRHIT